VYLFIQDKYGETALHNACQGGHAETARVLLDHGASVDLQNEVSQLSFSHLLYAACLFFCALYYLLYYCILPRISPPPPFSAVDMAQSGEGACIRICATHLEYKPPPADGFACHLFSAYIMLV
jgi:ankyrin repeat protein